MREGMGLQDTTVQALCAVLGEGTVTAAEGALTSPGVHATDFSKHGFHIEMLCRPEDVVTVAETMDKEGYFLEAITGVDWLKEKQLEVIYNYNRLGGEHLRTIVRVRVPRDTPQLSSITRVFPAADWHERETYDFYGVEFQGHPHLIRLLLPEDADFFPLRKDYMP